MIFVTGATGFLGKPLVLELIQQGYEVRILTRPSSEVGFFENLARVEIVQGDILDPPSLEQAMQGCQVVIHAAALFRFWGQAQSFSDTNVTGTENVLQAACRLGVTRFVYTSTIAVAGEIEPGTVITEKTSPNPVDPYQASKLRSEQVVQHYHRQCGLNTVILRLGALYGPYSRYAFNRLFFEEFLRGWRIQVSGGRHIIFPCFVADAARAIEAAIRLGKPGQVYNISGWSISHRDLNRLISRQAGRLNWRLNLPKEAMIATASLMELVAKLIKKEPFYPLNLKTYVFQDWYVDISKAQKELGFQPTPIEEGIRQTLAWYDQLGIK